MTLSLIPPMIGNEAIEVFHEARHEPGLLQAVRDVLSNSYRTHLGAKAQQHLEYWFDQVVDALQRGASVQEVAQASREAASQREMFRTYASYKRASLFRSLKIGNLLHTHGVVLDVGCGNNQLGEVLVQENPDVQVVGTDLFEPAVPSPHSRVKFTRLVHPDMLPGPDGSFDVVLFRFSLHHMSPETQELLLQETLRVLRPGGKVVCFEDTFSFEQPPLAGNVLLEALTGGTFNATQVKLALSMLDASSCLVMDEVMPFAFSFRSIEEWNALLVRQGFVQVKADYWGLPAFSLFQAPLGIVFGFKP